MAAPYRAAAALILVAFLAYASQAYAQPGDTVVLRGGAGEFYLASLPPGWRKRAEAADALGRHGDWLPAEQSLADWRDRLTVQLVPGLAGQAPSAFLDRLADLRAETCERMFATDVEKDTLNGFAVGFRVIACTRDKRTDAGEIVAVRALAGERALYVVQRAFRTAPFDPEAFPITGARLDAARAAIELGFACQRGSAARPCPADWRAVLDALDTETAFFVFPGGG